MSKKDKKGKRGAREKLEAEILKFATIIVDLEGELAAAREEQADLVAQWREVNDEAIDA